MGKRDWLGGLVPREFLIWLRLEPCDDGTQCGDFSSDAFCSACQFLHAPQMMAFLETYAAIVDKADVKVGHLDKAVNFTRRLRPCMKCLATIKLVKFTQFLFHLHLRPSLVC